MIRIVDYGLGNIAAFVNAYKRANIEVAPARTAGDLCDASSLILPGVGAFDHAMELLGRSGMRDTLERLVLEKKVPVLGICVGMQILARNSDEGKASGLGWIDARVRNFRSLGLNELRLPHMGWNDLSAVTATPLLDELQSGASFYFLHSYFFECCRAEDVAGVSSYGADFCSVTQVKNVYGVQFHPEKSHHFGMQLLKNFAKLSSAAT
jgi:glutamine amidotransferase